MDKDIVTIIGVKYRKVSAVEWQEDKSKEKMIMMLEGKTVFLKKIVSKTVKV